MNSKRRILVVEDQKRERDALSRLLRLEGYSPTSLPGLEQLSERISERFDLAICDLRLGVETESGLQALSLLRSRWPELPVIMLTAYGSIDSAVQAMRLGAVDYLTKPVTPAELLLLLNRYLPMDKRVSHQNQGNALGIERSLGRSPIMERLYRRIREIASTELHVLIRGELGSGHELVATAIHEQSSRKSAPFVEFRAAEYSTSTLATELFGTDRSDYFSRTKACKGKIALAHSGTLYIDDAQVIPGGIIARIREAFEPKALEPNATVRLLIGAYLHGDSSASFQSEFQNLFAESIVELPALRDHPEDIPQLIDYYLSECSAQHLRIQPVFDEPLREYFAHYEWPGNVRQLRNTIENLLVLSRGDVISMQDLFLFWSGESAQETTTGLAAELSLSDLEKIAVVGALRRCLGNKTHAAQRLGISVRTLQRKMKQWKLEGSECDA